MKTYDIELQKIKGLRAAQGMVYLQFDGVVGPRTTSGEGEPCSVLRFDEASARVLLALIKTQLLEFDKKKAKSRF